jgi:hypothetical protein
MSEQKERIVELKEFDIGKIPVSCTWIVIGPPKSGKSTFIEDLVYKNKHKYAVAKVWSGTEDTQGKYSRFVKPLFISNDYTELEHEKFVLRQRTCKNDGVKYPSAVAIMDDCNTDRNVFKSKIMKAQFKNGSQWWDNLFIIGSHYVFDMPPDLRKCVSYVAIFKETSIEERKKLWSNFAIGCNFHEFCEIMDQVTGDNTCLIFDKFAPSNKLEDCVFYYKADLHKENWEMGCQEFKEWHKERYNTKYIEQF